MNYPIVKVMTKDNLELFGFLAEAKNSKTIMIHMHGTAAAFYGEGFEEYFIDSMPAIGVSVLFTNNRGNYVMESWQNTGAALEKFEDCIMDIDAWIEFAFSKGYEKIILQGHSLGTEKIVFYMEKGKHKEKIIALSLLGFSDSYGCQRRFLDSQNIDPMNEAIKLVSEGRGEIFLTSIWKSHAGVLPQSAGSYANFFSPGSELSNALPIRKGEDLECFQNIKVPILAVLGDQDKWAIVSSQEDCELLKRENALTETYVISDCAHSFEGKQDELVECVSKFLSKLN